MFSSRGCLPAGPGPTEFPPIDRKQALGSIASDDHAQLMIIGNDQKPKIENGVNTMQHSGHDTLSIVYMSKPADLRIADAAPEHLPACVALVP